MENISRDNEHPPLNPFKFLCSDNLQHSFDVFFSELWHRRRRHPENESGVYAALCEVCDTFGLTKPTRVLWSAIRCGGTGTCSWWLYNSIREAERNGTRK